MMRTSKCKKCGAKILENDRNPNTHYSSPATLCWRCEIDNAKPMGAWLQDKNGNYYQKQ